VRLGMPLYFGLIIAAALAGPACCQDVDDSLRIYGVHIDRTPKQPWTGLGIYLGNGFVITPAHVAGLGFWRRPRVEVDGRDLPTKVLKDGHFHSVDITLLSVDERQLPVKVGLRRLALCHNSPWVGEEVIVVTRESSVRSHVISPYELPPRMPAKFQSVISYAPETAASGSGVFDANVKCLLGIISGKIWRNDIRQVDGHAVSEPHDVASYFVPSSIIADFIPSEFRF
jgi:hypothetical protein